MKGDYERRRAVNQAVRAWLARNSGVISLGEALELGLSPAQVKWRVKSGEWTRRHSGVYALAGAPRGPRQDTRAALLAVGQGAVASHRSAAWLWGLSDQAPAMVHLTVPVGCRAKVEGAALRRSAVPPVVEMRNGLACTTAVRTLIDCAATMAPAELADLFDRGMARRVVTLRAVRQQLDDQGAASHLPGRAILKRHLVGRGAIGGPTPSVLESRAARLFFRSGLVFKAQVKMGPGGEYRVDFADPEVPLIVEVDGFAWHSSPEHQWRDKQRRKALNRQGSTVLSYTWLELHRDPDGMIAEILAVRAQLVRAASRGASPSGGTAAAGW